MKSIRLDDIYISNRDLPGKYSWHEVKNFERDGWRLPSISDFEKLYNLFKTGTLNLKKDKYWTIEKNGNFAICVDLKRGYYPLFINVNNKINVRLIKKK